MSRLVLLPLIGILLLVAIFFPTSHWIRNSLAQTDHSYERRGSGADLRMEGTVREPVSAHFWLLSFTAYRETWSEDSLPRQLTVRFFAPLPLTAHVRVREIENKHSYRMDPIRTRWERGWSKFGPWPTDPVIAPLQIPPNNLGVVITESEVAEDSGRIFPALLFGTELPDKIAEYTFVVSSNTGLAPLRWSLYRVDHEGNHVRIELETDHVEKVAPERPHRIGINASSLTEGLYKIRFNGEWVSFTGRAKIRKHYTFFHKPLKGNSR